MPAIINKEDKKKQCINAILAGMTQKEIVKTLHISRSSVQRWVSEAKERIRCLSNKRVNKIIKDKQKLLDDFEGEILNSLSITRIRNYIDKINNEGKITIKTGQSKEDVTLGDKIKFLEYKALITEQQEPDITINYNER